MNVSYAFFSQASILNERKKGISIFGALALLMGTVLDSESNYS